MRPRVFPAAIAVLLILAVALPRPAAAAPDLASLRLPPGFEIEAWASGVTNARGLAMPNGVALRDGALYVGELTRILRYDSIEARLDAPPEPVVVAELPKERHHGARYIAFGPDDKLYFAIGAPCNVCDRDAEGFGTIIRMNPDGSGRETVAHGVRNSVGFAWRPGSRDLWFTDNGRDMLGDDVPSCELNRLTRPVDLLVLGDGSMLLSDDVSGVVYRITHRSAP